MSQQEKIKIGIEKVLHYSKRKVNFGEDADKLVIARNMDCMKKWTEAEISDTFDNGNVKNRKTKFIRSNKRRSMTANDPVARTELVRSTRKHVMEALKYIFADEQLEDSEMPKKPDYQRMAKELISEENIRNNFENSFIEYDRLRNY